MVLYLNRYIDLLHNLAWVHTAHAQLCFEQCSVFGGPKRLMHKYLVQGSDIFQKAFTYYWSILGPEDKSLIFGLPSTYSHATNNSRNIPIPLGQFLEKTTKMRCKLFQTRLGGNGCWRKPYLHDISSLMRKKLYSRHY